MSAPKQAAGMVAAMQDAGNGVLSGTHADDAAAGDADLFRQFEEEIQDIGGALAPPKRRGAGRPPGSVSRTTLQLQRFLLARGYRDPAEMLASLASADPVTLARDLAGYDADFVGPVVLDPDMVVRVLGIQRQAASDLMPYFHKRQAPASENDGKPAEARTLIVINEATPGSGEPRTIVVENQTFSGASAGVSHGDVSHEGEKR